MSNKSSETGTVPRSNFSGWTLITHVPYTNGGLSNPLQQTKTEDDLGFPVLRTLPHEYIEYKYKIIQMLHGRFNIDINKTRHHKYMATLSQGKAGIIVTGHLIVCDRVSWYALQVAVSENQRTLAGGVPLSLYILNWRGPEKGG